MADIVTSALRIGAKTDGAMDITVGPLVNLWGLGRSAAAAYPNTSTNRCGKSENRPATFAGYRQGWTSVLQKICRIFMLISTVGEGYAADHLARLMEQEGIARYLVSVGAH